MQGYSDRFRQPRIDLRVIGTASPLELSFVIDTGSDGSLCLPVEFAVELGLRLKGVQEVEYADGTIKRELVFLGTAILDDREFEVDIFLTDAQEALLGTQLLAGKTVVIDFRTGTVEVS